jgi:hypothetical protein
MSKILLIWLTSCVVFVVLGSLLATVEHTGPHDWFHLPGITIEHYSGRGLRVENIEPVMLLPALAICYGVTWFLFRVGSRYANRQTP